jgi:hypothetical protein
MMSAVSALEGVQGRLRFANMRHDSHKPHIPATDALRMVRVPWQQEAIYAVHGAPPFGNFSPESRPVCVPAAIWFLSGDRVVNI